MSEFFQHSFNVLGHGLIGYIVPFLFVLTIVVFFHELGHFLIARWAGVKVLTFSLGFGPELVGFNDRHGTRWKISAIPLGGYVKFFGDDSEASTPDLETLGNMRPRNRRAASITKRVGPRAAIVAAGPIANFLLAIVIFAGMSLYFGKPNSIPRVDVIQPDSVAAAAGFKVGDVVASIDGTAIESFADMQRIVSTNAGSKLTFRVKRDDALITLSATPALKEVKDIFGNSHKIGVLGIQYNAQPSDPKTDAGRLSGIAQDRRRAGLVHRRRHVQVRGLAVCRRRQHRGSRRTVADRAALGSGGQSRFPVPAAALRGAFGVDRLAESVPGAAVGWRSSFVLFGGGRAGASIVCREPRKWGLELGWGWC